MIDPEIEDGFAAIKRMLVKALRSLEELDRLEREAAELHRQRLKLITDLVGIVAGKEEKDTHV
jgi:hypothetical protein